MHREYGSPEQAAPDVARLLAASERGKIVVLARTTRLLRTVAEACVEPGVKISAPEAVFEPRGVRAALEGYFRLFADLEQATAEDVLTVFRNPSRGLPFEHEQTVVDGLRGGLSFTEIAAQLPVSHQNARYKLEDAARYLDGLRRITDAQHFVRSLRGPGGLDRHFEEYEQLFGGVEAVEMEQLEDAEAEAAGKTVAAYAKLLTDRTEALRSIRDDEHGIEVTTVHRAKGREWPTVVVFALDEGQLPHKKAIEAATPSAGVADPDAIESERRVAYVALTRAKQHLVLLSSKGTASRFLVEAGVVDTWKKPASPRKQPAVAQGRRGAPTRPRSTVPVFQAGDRLIHPLFGEGMVGEVEGQKLHVRFGKVTRSVLVSRQLQRLD